LRFFADFGRFLPRPQLDVCLTQFMCKAHKR